MRYYTGNIIKLEENEVFVFGSNLSGFHGAGAAGFASFNEFGNLWRTHDYDKRPNGWKGCWNIKGIGEGFQEGMIGKSYALPTVTKAGAKKSMLLTEISTKIDRLCNFVNEHPQYIYYIAQTANKGLNGYAPIELSHIWGMFGWGDNVLFEKSFHDLIKNSGSYSIVEKFGV